MTGFSGMQSTSLKRLLSSINPNWSYTDVWVASLWVLMKKCIQHSIHQTVGWVNISSYTRSCSHQIAEQKRPEPEEMLKASYYRPSQAIQTLRLSDVHASSRFLAGVLLSSGGAL